MHKPLFSKIVCLFVLTTTSFSCVRDLPESKPEEMARYIEAYPSAEIKAVDAVRIIFNEDVNLPDSIPSEDLSGMLKFIPSIKGKTEWDGISRELKFIPRSGQLKGGRKYFCEIRLGRVIPDAGNISFSFKVARPSAEMEVDNVMISPDDTEEALVSGKLRFSEPVGEGIVKPELLTTSATGKTVVMIDRTDESSFDFEIHGMQRSSAASSKVKLIFDAKSIGFGEKLEKEVEIPGKSEFKVMKADVVDAAQPYISVQFSGLLSDEQSLEGLVYLEDMEPLRIEREKSQVKLFIENSDLPVMTLVVDRHLKSSDGKPLGTDYRKTFRPQQIPPEVKLLIDDGILPDGNNLKLPFKAVNLCAVDVSVIKIFSGNVLSFYQDNDIDESYSLRRYGRIVYRKTARLDTDPAKNLHRWQDFSIDLKNLFRQEKGAIYRIRLSFKQEYSLYDRNDAPKNLPPTKLTEEDEKPWDSGYDWYDPWNEYNSDGWNWNERNDPTKPSYYMSSGRFPEINLVSSNIGIIVKSADDSRLWITTTDLVSSRPLQGVKVTAYNYQLQNIGEAYSDESGFVDIRPRGKAYIIQAEKGAAISHLRLKGHEKSLSRFDVAGKKITKGLKGYVYGERGVWRPGDTLHLTLLVEDKLHTLPASHPATMELYTPEGQLFGSKTLRGGKDGFYAFDIATESDSPTGYWNAVFSVGGAQFKKRIPVETIKPNRLKIKLSTTPETLYAGKEALINVSSHWLTGPVAANLDGTVDIVLHNTSVPFTDYRGYVFSNPLKDYSSEELAQIPFRLDNEGRVSISKEMPSQENAPGMLKADLICKISEPGGNTSTVANTVRFSPFSHYVGIDLKETEYETDNDLAFKVISVDAEGKTSPGRRLEYKIYRLGWNWWWECDADDLDSYVSGKSADLEASGYLTSRSDYVPVHFSVKYPDYGKFLILVKDVESGHTAGGTFFVDWPLWRGHSNKSNPDALTMLSFTTDRRSYETGETATIYIPASEGGHALVSFENASGVMSRRWVTTSATGETAWKFRVTDGMAPNFYIHITLLQPHSQTLNDLPIRMYGVQNVTVSNPASHLTPVIDCPDVVLPQTPFTVKVREERGKAMTYTIAVVDEGLLDLTGFSTPDPWTAMNEREALGVRTWDIYDDVVGAYAGKFTQVLSLGGDMALKGTKKENRFNPVVKFFGPFTLKGGTASHKIDLPMYVGSVRVMVVAGHAGAYGNAEKSVIVRSPLMLLPTLPRRLSPGESIKLPVNVFAMDPDLRDVQVKVQVSGPIKLDGKAVKRLHFASPGDSLVTFSLRADPSASSQGSVKITAEGGSFKAHESINIDIVNPNPIKTEVESRLLPPGGKASLSWETGSAGSAVLEIASFPAIDFTGAFEYVHSYKHLCTEQLSSNAFFLLYARDFLSDDDRAEAWKLLPGIISRLSSRQLPDGGFAYWPGDGQASLWATSMAGQALMEARRQGIQVQQNTIDNWVKFQRQAVKNYRHSDLYNLDDLDQAYRLYTLAIAGKADIAAMNRLKESEGLSLQARWRLAEAYTAAGKKELARQLTESSLISIATPSNGLGDSWWSETRDKAMIMDALVETGDIGKALKLASDISKSFSSRTASTQELAWVSRGMNSLAEAVGVTGLNVSVCQNNIKENVGDGESFIQKPLDFAAGKVYLQNDGSSSAHISLSVRRRPGIGETAPATSAGVKVSVNWQTLDGKPLKVDSLRQGTDFRALISVQELTGTTSSESMALTFTAPSGWEIWNGRLFGGEEENVEYKDIRDNEVHWYFMLQSGGSRQFTVRLQAAYEGSFILPGILCEDMYNPSYKSTTTGGRVCVSE